MNNPYDGLGIATSAGAVPLPGLKAGATGQRAVLLAMLSTASIPLPDEVEYRRDWRSYRIRLTFGDPPGEVETRELAAPEPPPGG